MILVTGGLGYLGSHIALYLMSKGHEVVLVDNLSHASMETLERLEYITKLYIPFIRLDVRNTPALQKVFEQYSIDYVINAAGFKSLHEAQIRPLDYYNNNIGIIMSLLRAMQRASVRRLVNLSSITVYGKDGTDFKEDDALSQELANPYIRAQQMVEQIFNDVYGVDDYWQITNLRLGNIIGAYEKGQLGEWVPPLPNSVLPYLLQVAAGQRDIFEIYNQALDTADGTAERSYLHVMDLSTAVYELMLWSNQQQNYLKHINVTHTDLTSLKQLIARVEALTEVKIVTECYQNNTTEFKQLSANNEQLKKLIEWEPKYNLDDMIKDQWTYYQNNLKKRQEPTLGFVKKT